jgi:hypothetical protein
MTDILDIDPRAWRESLGLSEAEAAAALDLSDKTGADTFRAYEGGRKEPAAPTLRLMDTTAKVVEALVLLRQGQPDEAKRILQRALTPPLLREVRTRAPGVEAVGPAPPQPPGKVTI